MHTISWFEIPTRDLERAQAFYETILSVQLINMDTAALKMRVFPAYDLKDNVSGALVFHEKFYEPAGHSGVLVYLNANPDLQNVLDRVPSAGGEIIIGKTGISDDFGFMAMIQDSEGNRIGLHSYQ